SILGFAHLLLEQAAGKLSPEELAFLQNIDQSAHRMAEMLEDFLRLLRLRSLPLSESGLNMNTAVNDVVAELKTQQNDWRVVFQIDPLPPARGDTGLIHQVWVNLIS